jgi:hypothetical protein
MPLTYNLSSHRNVFRRSADGNVDAEITGGIISDESIHEVIGSQALTQQILHSNRAIQ